MAKPLSPMTTSTLPRADTNTQSMFNEAVARESTGIVADVLNHDRQALARFITVVENRWPGWLDAMRLLYPHAGKARLVGITGSAGAGKSCLTAALALALHARGYRVAVIAIDPSSPITGGAVLGDRVRMSKLSEAGVYIRSLATRGSMGGLCQAACDVARILDAAGYEMILVETVGVGQDEVDIMRLAHTVVVLCTPGQGDGVQAIKAGLMEIGDLMVINKADLPGAEQVAADLQQMLHTRSVAMQRECRVMRTVATLGDGVDELAEAVLMHAVNAPNPEQKQVQFKNEVLRLMDAAIEDRLLQNPSIIEGNPYAVFQNWFSTALQTIETTTP